MVTSVSLYACSAVHSALLVGLLRAKMMGFLLLAAIVRMKVSVKAPPTAAAPMAAVGFTTSQTCSRFRMSGWSLAYTAFSGEIPPEARFYGREIVIVNLRFLQCPQKRSWGNQLIHRRLSKIKSIGSGADPEN